jgi:hypothetical protein
MGEPEPTRASIVMVAPPEVPRNAEGAHKKVKAALVDDDPVQRGQQYNHYIGRSL